MSTKLLCDAIQRARQTARLSVDTDGHEKVALDPTLWREIRRLQLELSDAQRRQPTGQDQGIELACGRWSFVATMPSGAVVCRYDLNRPKAPVEC